MAELTEEQKAEVEVKEKEVKKYAMLEAVKNSEGGIFIAQTIQEDVLGAIDNLRRLYKTATDAELRTWCAVLDSRISMLFLFKNAPANRKVHADDLAELMKRFDTENQ